MKSNQNFDNRSYRKTLTSNGLIYINNFEYEVRVLNLSLTGMFAELIYDAQIHDVAELRETLQSLPLIEIYLPDLRLAGSAAVVRVNETDDGFQIGFDFRNVSSDIENLPYKRKVTRKLLTAPEHINFNGRDYTFNTENLPVYDVMIRVVGRMEVEVGAVTCFDFKELDLQGEAKVALVDHDYNSTFIGLNYLHVSKEEEHLEVREFPSVASTPV